MHISEGTHKTFPQNISSSVSSTTSSAATSFERGQHSDKICYKGSNDKRCITLVDIILMNTPESSKVEFLFEHSVHVMCAIHVGINLGQTNETKRNVGYNSFLSYFERPMHTLDIGI